MTQQGSQVPVTVIIPTYNGRPYLEDALQSVCWQTHHDVEVVVDHGSTDSEHTLAGRP